MVLRKSVQCVEQIITKLDRTLTMDIYITIPFASLQSPLVEHHKLNKEGSEVTEYILMKPGDHEHISFEAMVAGENVRWSYAVYPF